MDFKLVKEKSELIIKKVFPFVFFAFLIIFILKGLLPNNGGLFYGDNSFLFNINNHINNSFNVYDHNYLGMDRSSIMGFSFLQNIFIYCLNLIGINDYAIIFIMIFLSIYTCLILYFLIFKKISNNYFFGIFASFLILFNNLTLEYFYFGSIDYYFFGLTGIVLLIYFIFKFKKKKEFSNKDAILMGLIFSLAFHPFIFLVFFILSVLFFLFFHIKNIKKALISLSIGFLINSYWIFSFIYNLFNSSIEEVYKGGGQDSVFQGFLKTTSYVYNINFFHYPNFIAKSLHQTDLHYYFYFCFLVLIVLILLFKKKKNIYLLTGLLIYFLFFELSLGPISIFFGEAWNWFWNNFSFFGFFRSYKRFLIPIIPIYLLIFSIFIRNLKIKKSIINFLIVVFILIILFFNQIFFLDQFSKVMSVARVPSSYYDLNNFLEKNEENFNILSFPIINYESYQWAAGKDYYFQENFLIKPIIYDRLSLILVEKNNFFKELFTREEIDYNNMSKYIDAASAKYILIHKDYINVTSKKNIDYKKYEDYFLNSADYNLIINNNEFYLFENKSYFPLLHSGDLIFKKESNIKFSLYLKNLNGDKNIEFLNNYNNNWGLYIRKYPNNNWCVRENKISGVVDCGEGNIALDLFDLEYLFRQNIFNNTHKKVYDYANNWTINSDYIKQNFSKEYYIENEDGSIDIEMVLYYKPQSYFYLGILISGITLMVCFGYLIKDKKREKVNEKN